MIELAGNILEGGGQILRNATALSCILGKPIKITDIRANRSKPGLRPQHLCGIQLLGDMSHAKLSGDQVNSCVVELQPSGQVHGGIYSKEVGTAGSLVLLLQSSLPVALFSDQACDLTLGGGTNAESAPPIDYFTTVFLPIAQQIGLRVDCQLLKRGFYPKGGGKVRVCIEPIKCLKPIVLLDRGEIIKVEGISYVSGQLPVKVAQQSAAAASKHLQKHLPKSVSISVAARYESASQATATGSGVFLAAYTTTGCIFGGTSIGKRGKAAEQVAREAADELLVAVQQLGCVDEHLQDQLIIFMALASGQSKVRCGPLTLHTETAIHIAKKLTGVEFEIAPQEDGTVVISCDGIAFQNSHL
ncbi:RNA 3'-terminal phosphate cyclase-like [Watersipora subatra]|uniref:RNA 3'-terminal phosphate cyclase-like n=1 Tax=Watersipora subatra TaxID=2589382 RepID=UPI00355C8E29